MNLLDSCCDCRTGKKSGAGGVGNGINSPGLKGEKLCGVGITFVEDSNGALYVKSLVNGGSAALSGQIQIGDVLFEVNRNNVYCLNPEEIGGYLLGHEGTQVELGFKRSAQDPVRRVLLLRSSNASSPAANAQYSSLSSGGYTNSAASVSAIPARN